MTIHDISATIEKALAAAGLRDGNRPLYAKVAGTIRQALTAVGLPQSPAPLAPDSGVVNKVPTRLDERPGAQPGRQPRPLGEMLAGSHSNGHAHRDYKLFVPSSYDGSAMPLVVMLHGCKQNPDDFARGTRMNEFAEEQGFLVAYPAQLPRANGSHCWNWFVPSEQARGGEEPSLIAGIVRQVGQSHAVDDAKVYAAGLSAGAAMAVILGAAYPEVFKAVGVHSGLPVGAAHDVASAFAAMRGGAMRSNFRGRPSRDKERFAEVSERGVPTIVFHGEADPTVHESNGKEVVNEALRHLVAAGAVLDEAVERSAQGERAVTVTTYRDAGGRTLVESWSIEGAGHAWSGGDAAGSFTDPLGPDASREFVRFFLAT